MWYSKNIRECRTSDCLLSFFSKPAGVGHWGRLYSFSTLSNLVIESECIYNQIQNCNDEHCNIIIRHKHGPPIDVIGDSLPVRYSQYTTIHFIITLVKQICIVIKKDSASMSVILCTAANSLAFDLSNYDLTACKQKRKFLPAGFPHLVYFH